MAGPGPVIAGLPLAPAGARRFWGGFWPVGEIFRGCCPAGAVTAGGVIGPGFAPLGTPFPPVPGGSPWPLGEVCAAGGFLVAELRPAGSEAPPAMACHRRRAVGDLPASGRLAQRPARQQVAFPALRLALGQAQRRQAIRGQAASGRTSRHPVGRQAAFPALRLTLEPARQLRQAIHGPPASGRTARRPASRQVPPELPGFRVSPLYGPRMGAKRLSRRSRPLPRLRQHRPPPRRRQPRPPLARPER